MIGVPEEYRGRNWDSIFLKVMKENFPNLVKTMDIKSRKHRVPNKMDTKRPNQEHIIVKMPKVKDKDNFKSSEKSS